MDLPAYWTTFAFVALFQNAMSMTARKRSYTPSIPTSYSLRHFNFVGWRA